MNGFVFWVKNSLRRILVRRRLVIWFIHWFFRIYNKIRYSGELFDRKEINLFSIDKLCAKIPYPANDMIFDNNVYGIGHVLKKYSGFKGQINAYIEHGVYFGNHYDRNQWFAGKIITFSYQRKTHLMDRTRSKDVHVIGPYIVYAEELFNEEYRLSLRTKLGKTLLVFPVHSTGCFDTVYDFESFISEIKRFKYKYSFDTVLICLFWKDVENKELCNLYINNNFKICSAGHKWDKDFLNRLKTIINLSDITLSNEVGTHIGYCTSLNKPHTIIESKVEYSPLNTLGKKAVQLEFKEERLIEINEVKSGFLRKDGSLNTEINSKQKYLTNKYWGNEMIKTKCEMMTILS